MAGRPLLLLGLLCLAQGTWSRQCAKNESSNLMCFGVNACNSQQLKLLSSGTSDLENKALLHLHNKLRQLVATGKVTGHQPARQMKQLVWNDELAQHMQRLAQQCMDPKALAAANNNVMGFDTLNDEAQVISSYTAHPRKQDGALVPLDDILESIYRNAVCNQMFPNTAVKCYDHEELAQIDPKLASWAVVIQADSYAIGCSKSLFENINPSGANHEHFTFTACYIVPSLVSKMHRLYKEGEPNCEVDSKVYPGLCTSEKVNAKAVDPCADPAFKKGFEKFCKDEHYTNFCETSSPFPLLYVLLIVGGVVLLLVIILVAVFWESIADMLGL